MEDIVAGNPATYRIYLNVRYDILGSKNAQLVSRDAFELCSRWATRGMFNPAGPLWIATAFSTRRLLLHLRCSVGSMAESLLLYLSAKGVRNSPTGGGLGAPSAARSQESGKRRHIHPESTRSALLHL